MISVHTSPLSQPGTGDAGGLNVYVVESARELAARGVEVEIFTRATSSADPASVAAAPGVTVRNVVAGPFEGLEYRDAVEHGEALDAVGVVEGGAVGDVAAAVVADDAEAFMP